MFRNQTDIKGSFNEDFCSHLEYHLTRTFGNSSNKKIRWFWCDGVKMPFVESQLFTKNIIETKQITTEAWIGVDGQDTYKMTIKLGILSTEKIIQGLTLIDCLPSENSLAWVKLDVERKEIILQLN
jgi:hypothetical protein